VVAVARGGRLLANPVAAFAFDAGQPKAGKSGFFFPRADGIVGFWATLSLNIPDFSRYAKSQRDHGGGGWGVVPRPNASPALTLCSSLHRRRVTSATTIIYGQRLESGGWC